MKKLVYALTLLPVSVKAGGMAAGSDRELVYVFLALVALLGILKYISHVLKSYWTKPEIEDKVTGEKQE